MAEALTLHRVQGSVASIPIRGDGSLGAPCDSKHHFCRTLDPALADRQVSQSLHLLLPRHRHMLSIGTEVCVGGWQESAHPHMICCDPSGRVLVPDLGLDCLFAYDLDPRTGGCDEPDTPGKSSDSRPRAAWSVQQTTGSITELRKV